MPVPYPDGLVPDLLDQLRAMRDVLQAFDLLEALIDPIDLSEAPRWTPEIDCPAIGALLRILNGSFASRLGSMESILKRASGAA